MNFSFSDILKNLGGVREQLEKTQERLRNMRISGEAGAGLLRVTVNGDGRMQGIEIDPVLLKAEEKEVLEELIISATNDAQKRARQALETEMKQIAGDLPIPGLGRFLAN